MKTQLLKKVNRLFLLFGLVLFAIIAKGQAADSVISLKSCINLSLANNLKLKQAQLESLKSKFQYREAIGAGLPQVSGFGALDDYFAIPVTMVPGEIFGQPGTSIPTKLGTKYNSNAGFEAGQIIYNPTYRATLGLFKKSCEITSLNLLKNQEELAYNIAQIYFLIQVTNLQLALLDSNLIAFQQVEKFTKQHYINGFIYKTDFDRVSVSIGNLEAEKENLLSLRNQQLGMMKYLIGIDQNQPLNLPEKLENFSAALVLSDSTFSDDTGIMILGKKTELAKLNLKLTRTGYYPSVAGFAYYGYQSQRDRFDVFGSKDNWYNTAFVGVKLNVPIFKGNQINNKVQQNKLELEQLLLAQNDLKAELNVSYLNALQKRHSSNKTATKLNDNVKLAGNIFRITNDQYRQGLKSLTDVLNAQSEINTARSAWLQALLQVKLSEIEILKINGGFRSLFLNQ